MSGFRGSIARLTIEKVVGPEFSAVQLAPPSVLLKTRSFPAYKTLGFRGSIARKFVLTGESIEFQLFPPSVLLIIHPPPNA